MTDFPSKNRTINPQSSRPTIGALVGQLDDHYSTSMLQGIVNAAREQDINLICFAGGALQSTYEFETQRNVIYDLASKKNVDGLVILSGGLGTFVGNEEIRAFCERFRPLPIVSIALKLSGIPSVVPDNYQGMCDVITHLIEVHGCQRIAFIRGPKKHQEAIDRYQAYIDTLAAHGLSTDDNMVTHGDFREEAGAEAINVLLDERKLLPQTDFDAVVAADDVMATGALLELQIRGVRIPQDVAVAGFDDTWEAVAMTPSLTTARQEIYELATRATEMLLAQMAGDEVPMEVILPVKLVVRQSCGCMTPEVIHAQVELPAYQNGDARIDFPLQRQRIVEQITRTVQSPAGTTIEKQAEQLVDAFVAELEGRSASTFLASLSDILRATAREPHAMASWQEAISVLRQHMLPHLLEEVPLTRAEDLYQQARILIAQSVQQAQAYDKSLTEQQAAILRKIGGMLTVMYQEDELFDKLAEILPQLGIPSCFLSQYECSPEYKKDEQRDLPEHCRLLLAYTNGQRVEKIEEHLIEGYLFDTHMLVPQELRLSERRYCMILEPLHSCDDQLGFALFEMGPREVVVYEALRGHLSSALLTARLTAQVKKGRQNLQSLFQASGSILSLQDPDTILQDAVDGVSAAIGASSADIVLIDEKGHSQRLTEGEGIEQGRTDEFIRSQGNGLSIQVMQSQEEELFPDLSKRGGSAYPLLISEGVRAAACFPFGLQEETSGVMWIYYSEPHYFTNTERNALRLYIDQIAIAYDRARQMRNLECLHNATEKLAGAVDTQEVLRQIASSAREILRADSAIIWLYENTRNRFLLAELATDTVSEKLSEWRSAGKLPVNNFAPSVVKNGYLSVVSLGDLKQSEYEAYACSLWEPMGMKSSQGIALQADGVTLGVLCVTYRKQHRIDKEDRATLETFAYHAALSLRKAKLLEQVRKTNSTARAVAQASTQPDLEGTLNAIVKVMQDALECDAVVLFDYNPATNTLKHPPTMVGVENQERAAKAGEVLINSIVYRILEQDEPYIVESVKEDPLFRDRRFAREERIESCVAIPLIASNEKVGVMFINFRTQHHFIKEEIDNVKLYAYQTAVAIHKAQLLEAKTRTTRALRAAYDAGRIVSGTLALEEILERIAEQAQRITCLHGDQANLSLIALVKSCKLSVSATCPSDRLDELRAMAGSIDLQRDEDTSILGNVAKTGQSQMIDELPMGCATYTLGARAQLAVPIKLGQAVLGVIFAEHTSTAAFDEDDRQSLEFLAAQAAIAIQNARQFQLRAGLLKAASVLTEQGDANAALETIAESVQNTIGCDMVCLYTYDQKTHEISYPSVVVGKMNHPELQADQHLIGPERRVSLNTLEENSVVRRLLEHNSSFFAFCSTQDPILGAGDFVTREGIQSSAGIILKTMDEIVGILFVNYRSPHQFGDEEMQAIEIFAAHAALAIQSARRYEELRRMKGLIGSQSALSWMSMASGIWRHTVDKHALTIQEQALLLCDELAESDVPFQTSRGVERVQIIERLATNILEKSITMPLSTDTTTDLLSLSDFVKSRTKQLWRLDPYKTITLDVDTQLPNAYVVQANAEWLQRALDILIDEIIEALTGLSNKEISIVTRLARGGGEIEIQGTGQYTPTAAREIAVREAIEKEARTQNPQSMMVQAIVEAYGGELRTIELQPMGRCSVLWLPAKNMEV